MPQPTFRQSLNICTFPPKLARLPWGIAMATRGQKAAKSAKAPKRARPARKQRTAVQSARPTRKQKSAKTTTSKRNSATAKQNELLRAAEDRLAATADILKVIASSPSDVQPVFDVIVERAVQLCGARMGRVYRYDGQLIHMVGGYGLTAPGRDSAQRPFPRPASDDTIVGRVILSRRPNILPDLHEDNTVPSLSRQMIQAIGARSQVTMPMLLSGKPIGAITLSWSEPRGYNDQQIALLRTFSDQAVIAIENTRLFKDTHEALERQTATAEILKVIASSPNDVQPVFETIAERSNRLVSGLSTAVYRRIDDMLYLMAFTPVNPEADAALQATFPAPISLFGWADTIEMGKSYVIADAELEFAAQPAILNCPACAAGAARSPYH
jgi:hypothetical protein